jgi:hypothetical protein
LVLQSHPDVLRIAAAAVCAQEQHSVFLVKGGWLAEVPFTLGHNDGRCLEIVAGLTSKDLVVRTFSSQNDLTAGQMSRLASTQ